LKTNIIIAPSSLIWISASFYRWLTSSQCSSNLDNKYLFSRILKGATDSVESALTEIKTENARNSERLSLFKGPN
jgi:hypothetical protein